MRVKKLHTNIRNGLNIEQFRKFNNSSMREIDKNNALLVECGGYIYHVGNYYPQEQTVYTLGEHIYFNLAL